MPDITLLDVAKRTGNDQVVGLIEESLAFAPEMQTLPIRLRPGTSYTTLKRTAFGGGGFRDANKGTARIKSTYDKVTVQMYYFDAQMQIDEQLVSADPDLLIDEGVGAVRGSMINLGQQIFSGRAKDSKGFDGFKNQVASEMIVDAQGTGNTETVYFVVEGVQGVHVPMNENTLLELGEWMKQMVNDSDGNPFKAWVNNLSAWLGLQLGHKYAVGAIKNITTAKPLTDALGAELLAKFPTGMVPTHCFMSRHSKYLLQNSRSSVGATKTNSAGDSFAPTPTLLADVPIVTTDSIVQVTPVSWS
ncbi:hypothetical protein QEH52_01735 [Coraliomargarita sp. SDUM461003]|uniref:Major capsid protein n=1 Tax=Thalassobacterium maritimum TaxID=3041265 RepID=A0ABU1APW0_9BACT|nr:hypothetical protein [Coraliomargarita sp. SDUM461003]MDQ8206213.1 hypothetical protein [Coraliomargarita sp. SDUM461003]